MSKSNKRNRLSGSVHQVAGPKIEIRSPNNTIFYFPSIIAEQAKNRETYNIFFVSDLFMKSGIPMLGVSYIVSVTPEGNKFLYTGSVENVVGFYGDLSWDERTYANKDGIFAYKEAPDKQTFEKFIVELRGKDN